MGTALDDCEDAMDVVETKCADAKIGDFGN